MYSLTIIGGGAISCGYDQPKDEVILTHVHGALCHPDIQLDALIEVNKQRQQYIRKKWGKNFDIFSDLKTCGTKYKSDIVVIATPTVTHLSIIEELLLLYSPQLIICEKPIVSSLIEFEKLNILLSQYNTKIITHFPRRFDPSINILQNIILNAKKINHFYGTFTKGLLHNGSHMLDLISMLIGKMMSIEAIDKSIIDNDLFGKFLIKTDKCSGIISNIDNDKLALFEFTIYTDIAKIEIVGHKQNISINYIEKSQKFNDYMVYSKNKILDRSLDKYGYNIFDSAISLIEDNIKYLNLSVVQKEVNNFIFLAQNKFLKD